MKSRWNDDDAARYVRAALASGHSGELGLRIYSSRIIGGDPELVLHGGGNTLVKVKASDGEELMRIKGSGWDLDSIEAPGLPAVRLSPLLVARNKGERLPDPDMVALLRANLIEQGAPNPSVEALLHAFLRSDYPCNQSVLRTIIVATSKPCCITAEHGGRRRNGN